MNVSACLVTRGDVDMTEIRKTLRWADEILIWNNGITDDYGIYGRYAVMSIAQNDVIVTQDDDVLVTCWPQILAAYKPGVLTVNYPEPWDIPWLARGAIFDRHLPDMAFERYSKRFPADDYFKFYACDGIFALLTETQVVDFGSEDLPHGFAPGRVSTSSGWYEKKRPLIQQRCAQLV